jgi:hypothetical protein
MQGCMHPLSLLICRSLQNCEYMLCDKLHSGARIGLLRITAHFIEIGDIVGGTLLGRNARLGFKFAYVEDRKGADGNGV